MKKQLVTAMVVAGALALGACQEDPLMDQRPEDMELNQSMEPEGDSEDEDIPPNPNKEGEGVGKN